MANALERVKDALSPPSTEVPKEIEEKTNRGRARMKDGASVRNEAMKFWRGDQYVYRAEDGMLINQQTITLSSGGGKPRHRVRTTRNMIFDIVEHEVSGVTSRVPAYEVNPSTSEPQDYQAAAQAGKVLRYGYDKWSLRQVTESVVKYAVIAGEGFAWPYWDSSVGPYMKVLDPDTGEEKTIGEGEVGVRIFGPNEVYWEPGLKFEESRWHVVEQARPLEDVQAMEGFNKTIKLTPDASADEDGVKREKVTQHAKLVLVKEYLERPSLKDPSTPHP